MRHATPALRLEDPLLLPLPLSAPLVSRRPSLCPNFPLRRSSGWTASMRRAPFYLPSGHPTISRLPILPSPHRDSRTRPTSVVTRTRLTSVVTPVGKSTASEGCCRKTSPTSKCPSMLHAPSCLMLHASCSMLHAQFRYHGACFKEGASCALSSAQGLMRPVLCPRPHAPPDCASHASRLDVHGVLVQCLLLWDCHSPEGSSVL